MTVRTGKFAMLQSSRLASSPDTEQCSEIELQLTCCNTDSISQILNIAANRRKTGIWLTRGEELALCITRAVETSETMGL